MLVLSCYFLKEINWYASKVNKLWKKKSILNYKLKKKKGLQLCLDSKRKIIEKVKLKMEVGFSHIYVLIGSIMEW